MGSCKEGYKSPNLGYNYIDTLLIHPTYNDP